MVINVGTSAAAAAGPQPQTGPAPELLDVRAVAALLGGCSTRHVYRQADAGRMPAPIRLGSLVRWRRAELIAWVAGGCNPVHAPKSHAK